MQLRPEELERSRSKKVLLVIFEFMLYSLHSCLDMNVKHTGGVMYKRSDL